MLLLQLSVGWASASDDQSSRAASSCSMGSAALVSGMGLCGAVHGSSVHLPRMQTAHVCKDHHATVAADARLYQCSRGLQSLPYATAGWTDLWQAHQCCSRSNRARTCVNSQPAPSEAWFCFAYAMAVVWLCLVCDVQPARADWPHGHATSCGACSSDPVTTSMCPVVDDCLIPELSLSITFFSIAAVCAVQKDLSTAHI